MSVVTLFVVLLLVAAAFNSGLTVAWWGEMNGRERSGGVQVSVLLLLCAVVLFAFGSRR